MSLEFYYDLLSQPSRALLIILRMSGTQFKDCPVALRSGEHLTEEFKQNINRFQRVPCIIDDGFKLAESVAVLRYLSAKGKIPEHLYPKYFVEQARVDEFLEWQHITLRLTCALYFRTVWLDPLMTGTPPKVEKVAALKNQMESNLDIVENVWLAKTDFLTGQNLRVADIFAACEIEQTREHLTEEFKQNINRFQRVPCIIDDGFKLAESVAVLRYLSAKGKIPEHLYPKYFVEQARVDEFLEWQHITLRLTCALYFRTVWLDPLMTGTPPKVEKVAALKNQMESNLDIVENVWLAKTDFLTGQNLRVADIFAACEIEQTRLADYDVRIKYPKIKAWLKRVRASCNPHYDYAHQAVYKISGTAPNAKL